jgi:hypothetical protein
MFCILCLLILLVGYDKLLFLEQYTFFFKFILETTKVCYIFCKAEQSKQYLSTEMHNARFQILVVVLLTIKVGSVIPCHLVSGYQLSKIKGLLTLHMTAL